MKALCAALLIATLSQAQAFREPPKVYQVRIHGVGKPDSSSVPQRLDAQLRRELGRSQDSELQTERTFEPGGATRVVDPSPGEARALAKKGADQLLRGDAQGAIATLESAISSFEATLATLDRFSEYLQSLWLLGVAQVQGGKLETGDEVFQKLLTLAPDHTPNLTGQPDEVGGIWDSVRRRISKRKPGSLQITVSPRNAEVTVDDRRAGRSSAKISGLLPGTHFVVARAPGMQPRLERVEVESGGAATVNISLEAEVESTAGPNALVAEYHNEIARWLSRGVVDVRIKRVARGFSDATDSDYLVLAYLQRQPAGYRLRTYVFKREGAQLAEMDPVAFDQELMELEPAMFRLSRQIVAAILSFPNQRDITAVARGPAPSGSDLDAATTYEEDSGSADSSPPFYKKWWFWTAVGVAAAAGAGIGIYAATSGGTSGTEIEVSW